MIFVRLGRATPQSNKNPWESNTRAVMLVHNWPQAASLQLSNQFLARRALQIALTPCHQGSSHVAAPYLLSFFVMLRYAGRSGLDATMSN